MYSYVYSFSFSFPFLLIPYYSITLTSFFLLHLFYSSTKYDRIWLLGRLQVPLVKYFVSTNQDLWVNWLLRMLGGNVDYSCHWGDKSTVPLSLHLFSAGADANFDIMSVCATEQYRTDGIIVGPIVIGRNACIGIHAYIGPFTTVGEGTEVLPTSTLQFVATSDNEQWTGNPATKVTERKVTLPILSERQEAAIGGSRWSLWSHAMAVAFIVSSLDLCTVLVTTVLVILLLPIDSLSFLVLDSPSFMINFWKFFSSMLLFFVLTGIIFQFVKAFLICFYIQVLGKITPGMYPSHGWISVVMTQKRKLYVSLFELFGSGCLYSSFMALAGVSFESGWGNSECSQCIGLLPDTTCVGKSSFWGQNSLSNACRFKGKTLTIGVSRFPESCFLGNHAVLSEGNYRTDCLIGVGTYVPPDTHAVSRHMASRRDPPTTVFGNPMFHMPLRDTQTTADLNSTKSPYLPTFFEYVRRIVMFDLMRMSLPAFVICLVSGISEGILGVILSFTATGTGAFMIGEFFIVFSLLLSAAVVVPCVLFISWLIIRRLLRWNTSYRTVPGEYAFWGWGAQGKFIF